MSGSLNGYLPVSYERTCKSKQTQVNPRYWIYKPKNSEEVAVEVCGGASVSHTASSREALETQTNSSSLNATQCLFSFLYPPLICFMQRQSYRLRNKLKQKQTKTDCNLVSHRL